MSEPQRKIGALSGSGCDDALSGSESSGCDDDANCVIAASLPSNYVISQAKLNQRRQLSRKHKSWRHHDAAGLMVADAKNHEPHQQQVDLTDGDSHPVVESADGCSDNVVPVSRALVRGSCSAAAGRLNGSPQVSSGSDSSERRGSDDEHDAQGNPESLSNRSNDRISRQQDNHSRGPHQQRAKHRHRKARHKELRSDRVKSPEVKRKSFHHECDSKFSDNGVPEYQEHCSGEADASRRDHHDVGKSPKRSSRSTKHHRSSRERLGSHTRTHADLHRTRSSNHRRKEHKIRASRSRRRRDSSNEPSSRSSCTTNDSGESAKQRVHSTLGHHKSHRRQEAMIELSSERERSSRRKGSGPDESGASTVDRDLKQSRRKDKKEKHRSHHHRHPRRHHKRYHGPEEETNDTEDSSGSLRRYSQVTESSRHKGSVEAQKKLRSKRYSDRRLPAELQKSATLLEDFALQEGAPSSLEASADSDCSADSVIAVTVDEFGHGATTASGDTGRYLLGNESRLSGSVEGHHRRKQRYPRQHSGADGSSGSCNWGDGRQEIDETTSGANYPPHGEKSRSWHTDGSPAGTKEELVQDETTSKVQSQTSQLEALLLGRRSGKRPEDSENPKKQNSNESGSLVSAESTGSSGVVAIATKKLLVATDCHAQEVPFLKGPGGKFKQSRPAKLHQQHQVEEKLGDFKLSEDDCSFIYDYTESGSQRGIGSEAVGNGTYSSHSSTAEDYLPLGGASPAGVASNHLPVKRSQHTADTKLNSSSSVVGASLHRSSRHRRGFENENRHNKYKSSHARRHRTTSRRRHKASNHSGVAGEGNGAGDSETCYTRQDEQKRSKKRHSHHQHSRRSRDDSSVEASSCHVRSRRETRSGRGTLKPGPGGELEEYTTGVGNHTSISHGGDCGRSHRYRRHQSNERSDSSSNRSSSSDKAADSRIRGRRTHVRKTAESRARNEDSLVDASVVVGLHSSRSGNRIDSSKSRSSRSERTKDKEAKHLRKKEKKKKKKLLDILESKHKRKETKKPSRRTRSSSDGNSDSDRISSDGYTVEVDLRRAEIQSSRARRRRSQSETASVCSDGNKIDNLDRENFDEVKRPHRSPTHHRFNGFDRIAIGTRLGVSKSPEPPIWQPGDLDGDSDHSVGALLLSPDSDASAEELDSRPTTTVPSTGTMSNRQHPASEEAVATTHFHAPKGQHHSRRSKRTDNWSKCKPPPPRTDLSRSNAERGSGSHESSLKNHDATILKASGIDAEAGQSVPVGPAAALKRLMSICSPGTFEPIPSSCVNEDRLPSRTPATAPPPARFTPISLTFTVNHRPPRGARHRVYVCGSIPQLGGSVDPRTAMRSGVPLDRDAEGKGFADHWSTDMIKITAPPSDNFIYYIYYVIDEGTSSLVGCEELVGVVSKRTASSRGTARATRSLLVPHVKLNPNMSEKQRKENTDFVQVDAKFNDLSKPGRLCLRCIIDPSDESDDDAYP